MFLLMDTLIYYKKNNKSNNVIINKYNEAIMSGACPNIIACCPINYILLKVYLAKFTYTYVYLWEIV